MAVGGGAQGRLVWASSGSCWATRSFTNLLWVQAYLLGSWGLEHQTHERLGSWGRGRTGPGKDPEHWAGGAARNKPNSLEERGLEEKDSPSARLDVGLHAGAAVLCQTGAGEAGLERERQKQTLVGCRAGGKISTPTPGIPVLVKATKPPLLHLCPQ